MKNKVGAVKNTIRKYSKESLVVILGQICIFIVSIFGVKLLTSLMSPTSYGELMLYNTIFMFSTMLLYNPLQQATARYYNTYYFNGQDQLDLIEASIIKYTKNNYIYNFVVICIFAVFFYFYKGPQSILGCIFLLIYCISFSQITLYTTAFNSIKNRYIAAFIPLVEKILKPVLGAILIFYLFDSSIIALAGQAISGIIVLFLSILLYRNYINQKHLRGNIVTESNKVDNEIKMFMKTIPIRTFFLWIFLSSDRWVLELFTTTRDVGLYSALNQIGYSPLTQVAGVVGIFISPYIYDKHSVANEISHKSKRIINSGTLIFLIFSFIIFISGFYLQDFVFKYFVDNRFSEVAYLLPFVMLSGGLFVTSQFYALKALVKLKPELLIVPSLITSLVGVTLYIIMGYYYHTQGIVYANVINNIILLVLTYIYCNK